MHPTEYREQTRLEAQLIERLERLVKTAETELSIPKESIISSTDEEFQEVDR